MINLSILMCVFISKNGKIYKFFDNIESAIQIRSENASTAAYFTASVEKMEKFTKWFLYSFQITFVFLMLPMLVITLYTFFTDGLQTEDYQLPFFVWQPFNWRRPIGYLIAYTLQCGAVHYLFMYCVIWNAFQVITSLLFVTFAKDAKQELKNINELNKTGGNEAETIKRFHKIIQYIVDAKQFVSDYNHIYMFAILTFLTWGILTVCGTLMMIQIELSQEHTDWASFVISFFQLFWTFVLMFLLCYSGQEVTGAFDDLMYEVYQCEWDSFPHPLRRILPILLIFMKEPVQIIAYGGVNCSLKRFKKIVNGGYSYYAILREFY
ncbi:odorant receptor 94a-like [Contarinia nasturtii]|uniref:odorant receptor 94a-like n=1 Tax=Contarinia nasturtii TaxID=265458 RepID=UPI0012D4B625|nr:odorant receptor 94a-like [Contarinia nasturtii]